MFAPGEEVALNVAVCPEQILSAGGDTTGALGAEVMVTLAAVLVAVVPVPETASSVYIVVAAGAGVVIALPAAIGAPPEASVYQLNVPVPVALNVAVCPEQIEALDGVTVGAEGAVV